MARTYPLSLKYRMCLGRLEDPCSFSSIYLEDLYSGQRTYIHHVQQLVNALPKSLDPTWRFSLRAQVTPPGHQHMRDSLRTALWWLLPADGDFRRAPNGFHYYLARQGRRVVLRGGNVTSPFHQSHLNWVHDPAPPPSRRLESRNTAPRSDSRVNSSAPIPRNPLDPIPSASWNNSSMCDPSVPHPSNSVCSNLRCVPRNNNSENEVSAIATRGSSPAPLSSAPPKKCRMRRRRQARRAANRNTENSSAAPLTQDARWANQRAAVPAGATQPLPENSDPISARRTAVYPPSRIVGDSLANENSPFQIGLESSRIPAAIPDQQQDTQARPFSVNNSGSGTSSPPYLLPYTKPFSGRPAGSSMTSPTREAGETLRSGSGILYLLQPRAHRPDTRVTVDAALPEPASFQRQDLPPTVVELGSPIQSQKSPAARRRASRKPSRKRRRNRSTAVFQPAKRSPSCGH